jgi:hypothetical protein
MIAKETSKISTDWGMTNRNGKKRHKKMNGKTKKKHESLNRKGQTRMKKSK